MKYILIILKWYFLPIFRYFTTGKFFEEYKNRTLEQRNKSWLQFLDKKREQYRKEKLKEALSNFDSFLSNIVSQEGFSLGTIDDSEEMAGGFIMNYTKQEIQKIEHNVYEYNQLENKDLFGGTQCFLYAQIGEISDNLNFLVSPEERKKLSELSQKSKDYDLKVGGLFSEGRRIVNDYLDSLSYEYTTYSMYTNSSNLRRILDLGYSITTGVKLTDEMAKGLKDGILQKAELVGGIKKYNHLVRLKKSKDGKVDMWIDNYIGVMKSNTITIEELESIAKNERFMNTSYFTVGKEKEKEKTKAIFKDIPLGSKDEELAKYALSIGIKGDEKGNLNLDEKMTRREFLMLTRRIKV